MERWTLQRGRERAITQSLIAIAGIQFAASPSASQSYRETGTDVDFQEPRLQVRVEFDVQAWPIQSVRVVQRKNRNIRKTLKFVSSVTRCRSVCMFVCFRSPTRTQHGTHTHARTCTHEHTPNLPTLQHTHTQTQSLCHDLCFPLDTTHPRAQSICFRGATRRADTRRACGRWC